MEYIEKHSIKIFHVKNIEIKENFFGYPIGLPVAQVNFKENGQSCPEPLTLSYVAGLNVTGNIAVKASSSLVEVDHPYSDEDIMEKITINTTLLLMPCVCEDSTSDSKETINV